MENNLANTYKQYLNINKSNNQEYEYIIKKSIEFDVKIFTTQTQIEKLKNKTFDKNKPKILNSKLLKIFKWLDDSKQSNELS